jgi:Zn-dependent oligopeptidase
MEGLNLILSNLFGIRLRETNFHPNETWHPFVHRLELLEGDSLLGVIYLGF